MRRGIVGYDPRERRSSCPAIALVVDDEPLILLDTSDIVMDAGYQVVEATTADQALAYLETHAVFDLLVTDIQMPGTMDGIALARHVGERGHMSKFSSCPVQSYHSAGCFLKAHGSVPNP